MSLSGEHPRPASLALVSGEYLGTGVPVPESAVPPGSGGRRGTLQGPGSWIREVARHSSQGGLMT